MLNGWRQSEWLRRKLLTAASWQSSRLRIFKWTIIPFPESSRGIKVWFFNWAVGKFISWSNIAHVNARLIWSFEYFQSCRPLTIFPFIYSWYWCALIMIHNRAFYGRLWMIIKPIYCLFKLWLCILMFLFCCERPICLILNPHIRLHRSYIGSHCLLADICRSHF